MDDGAGRRDMLVLRYLHNSALQCKDRGQHTHRFHFLCYFTDDDIDNDDYNNVTDNDNNNYGDNDSNNDGGNDINNDDDNDNDAEAATRQFLIPNKSCSSRRNFPEAPRKKKKLPSKQELDFFWLKSF